jgi:hypothetical protein
MSAMINEPKYILPFLQPGRLVTVSFFWSNQSIGFKILSLG